MLKAGVALRNITPKEKILLCGYPEPKERWSRFANDPLYGSVYYFENSGVRLMCITLDLTDENKDRANELRMLIEKHTGIPRGNISVSAIHTHSAPETGGDPWGDFQNKEELFPAYNDYVRDLMVEAAKEAVATAFDAKVGYGVGSCGAEAGVGGNRHDPKGPCDPSVTVLAIRDQQDALRGCIVNYSMHPTVMQAENLALSADFPAYIRQYLNSRDPFMVFGFYMGSAGNQSTRHFRKAQDFAEARRIGEAIAREAARVLEGLDYTQDPLLRCASVFVTPPVKQVPTLEEAAETARRAQADYDGLLAQKAPYPLCRTAECTLIGSNFMRELAKSAAVCGIEEIICNQIPIEVQGMVIGDCLMVGIACEHFVEIGNRVKQASPFKVTMINSLTNGSTNGYVVCEYAYDEFCYEAQETTFDRGAEQALTQGCMELLELLKA